MKKMMTLFLAGQLMVGTLLAGPNDPISIPGPNFKAALLAVHDTNHDGQISEAEALAVTQLSLSNKSIGNLTGLRYFTNVEILDLSHNLIASMPDLSALTKIRELYINNNVLTSFPHLFNQRNLERFHIQHNRLTSFPFLGQNEVITHLFADHNRLTWIQNLGNYPTLEMVHLENNRLDYIPPARSMPNLTLYQLAYNDLTESAEICEALTDHEYLDGLVYLPTNSGDPLTCTCEIVLAEDPVDVTTCYGEEVRLGVDLVTPLGDFTVKWFRADGSDARTIGGELRIDELTPAFEDRYFARITSKCETYDTPPVTVAAWRDEPENPCAFDVVFWSGEDMNIVSGVEDLGADTLHFVLTAPPPHDFVIRNSTPAASAIAIHPEQILIPASDWTDPRRFIVRPLEDGVVAQLVPENYIYRTLNLTADHQDLGVLTFEQQITVLTNNQERENRLWFDGNIQALPGTEVTFPVRVDLIEEVVSGRFLLFYDGASLIYSGFDTEGTLTEDWLVSVREANPLGFVEVAMAGPAPLGVRGTLFNLRFVTVDRPVGRMFSVLPESVTFNDLGYGTSTLSGGVELVDCMPGDLDGDRTIKAFDASVILHQVVELAHPFLNPAPECGDADCDGDVDAFDAQLVFSKAIGESVSLCAAAPPFGNVTPVVLSADPLVTPAERDFELPLMVSPMAEAALESFQFELNYDPDRLTLTGIETSGGLAGAMTTLVNDQKRGRLIVAGFGQGVLGEGLLLKLKGQAGGFEGETLLTWRRVGFNNGEPNVTAQDLVIRIRESIGPQSTGIFLFTGRDTASASVTPRVDGDPADSRYGFEVISEPLHGVLSFDADRNGMIYTPDPGFVGRDLFVIRAEDDLGRHVDGVGRALVVPSSYFLQLDEWRGGGLLPLVRLINDPGGVQ